VIKNLDCFAVSLQLFREGKAKSDQSNCPLAQCAEELPDVIGIYFLLAVLVLCWRNIFL